jgi:hypothetical protein
MKNTKILSNVRSCFITLTHNYPDPGMWIVKHWTKLMWFKKLISSVWFNDEQQALAYANNIMLEHSGKELPHHAK